MSLSVQAMPRGRAKRTYTFPATSFDTATTGVPVMIRTTTDTALASHAKSDGSNLRFLLPDGTAPPQVVGYTGVLETDVAWTVPSEPYAVRHVDEGVDRTFVGLYRHQDSAFDIGQYDHLTGNWSVTRLADITEVDDHNGVTIAIHPDGTVFAFCPQHNTANLRCFRSDSPADISAMTELSFGSVDVANASYALPIFVGTKLFVTWRDGEVTAERPRVYVTSDDKGNTWSLRKELIRQPSERPYCHLRKANNDDIHIVFTPALDTEIPDGQNHIYHAVLRLSNESFYATDGTLIGTVDAAPLSSSNATLAMSAVTGGKNLRTANVGFDSVGNPVCGVLEIRSAQENVYHQARWNGTAWTNEEIVTGGETLYGPKTTTSPGYLPGLFQCLDGDKMLASVQVGDRTHEVREYVRSSSGIWSYKVISSANSGEKLRPCEVINGHSEMQYLFLSGEYHKSTSSDTRLDLCAYPGPIATGRITALVELDFDGLNDVVLELTVDVGPIATSPLSDAILLSVGEIGRRTILDDSSSVLDGLSEITLLGVATPASLSVHQYYASDYGTLTTERHLLFRLKFSSGNPNLALRLTDETTYQVEGTDIAATAGATHALGASYDGSALRIARNGSLSTASTAATLSLRDSDAVPLYAGAAPNAPESDQVRGSQDLLAIFPTGKSTDWLRMATLGCGPAAYTTGSWSDLPELDFAGTASSPTVVGGILQN